ncbi:hypothetical protein [Bradyrhizobium sp. AS23.2]|uniref:hypothetical protein n=1 Tax=Bradyrhizobium sp. AS23.2 TaxID=1680155 RepID=UPI00116128D5|nr:hypothetical protein [Bradyrhizobium sp. AS23.2]
MDIDAAISEPLVKLIAFHNAFNRNIKVSFGSLEMLSGVSAADRSAGLIALPTGTEPWGRETRWRNLDQPVKEAAGFLAEMGLARATASFEDYLTGAKAEFDRVGLVPAQSKRSGTSAMHGFDAIVGIKASSIADLARMATFFGVARNCVVHRANRASGELAALCAEPAFLETLARWPKRVGKWKLSLPSIREGHVVDWRPRHAIMASDVYYRCATTIDRVLVQKMGAPGLVRMAAHWCFFADSPAPCPAKLNPETMVRSQLVGRYLVRATSLAGTVASLRSSGQWDAARAAFERRYPNGPETSLATRRRARRSGRAR